MAMVGKRVLYWSSTGHEMVQVVCTERFDKHCQLATCFSVQQVKLFPPKKKRLQ